MKAPRRALALRRLTARRRLLRAAVAASSVMLGWAIATAFLVSPPTGDGEFWFVGLLLEERMRPGVQQGLFALVAAAAAASWMFAIRSRSPAPVPGDAQKLSNAEPVSALAPALVPVSESATSPLSMRWLLVAALLTAHLPAHALVAVLVAAGACAALVRWERSLADPLLAAGVSVAALTAGAFAALGVTNPNSLLAGGLPLFDAWPDMHVLPQRATLLVGMAVMLLAAGRTADIGASLRSRALQPFLTALSSGMVIAIAVLLLGDARWEFSWHQSNATVFFAVFACAIAALRILGGYRRRQRTLDGDGVVAAWLLVSAALGLGLCGSLLAFATSAALFFATRGERPARWARTRPGGWARRIRPTLWPLRRGRPARPGPYAATPRSGAD